MYYLIMIFPKIGKRFFMCIFIWFTLILILAPIKHYIFIMTPISNNLKFKISDSRQNPVGAEPVQAHGGTDGFLQTAPGATENTGGPGGSASLQQAGQDSGHVRAHLLRPLAPAECECLSLVLHNIQAPAQ